MAMTNTLDAVTREIYLPTLTNNFYRASPLLKYLTMHTLKQPGGETIIVNLEYAAGAVAAGYHRSTTTPGVYVDDATSMPDFIKASYAPWKYLRGYTWVQKIDLLQNQNDAQIIDLVGARFKALERTLRNTMITQLFTAAADGSDYLSGLPDVISASDPTYPTGGLQVLPVATYAWWKAQENTATGTTLLDEMQQSFDDCQQDDGDIPDLIITTQAVFEAYLKLAEAKSGILRDTNTKTADLGFFGATFAGGTVPVVWDSHCAATKMYFLNSDYLQLLVHSQDEFGWDGWKEIPNTRDVTGGIYWTGNLICKKRSTLGVLTVTL